MKLLLNETYKDHIRLPNSIGEKARLLVKKDVLLTKH